MRPHLSEASKKKMPGQEKPFPYCQESGKPVTAWCEENGISPSTYYRKLRMMREDILSGEQQIVPIKPRVPHGIKITAGEISIAMPENADPEQLAAIVGALKSC